MYQPTNSHRGTPSTGPAARSTSDLACWQSRAVGVCVGAATISLVGVAEKRAVTAGNARDRIQIVSPRRYAHEGDPRGTLLAALSRFDSARCQRLALTGRRYRNSVNLSSISEPEAVGLAYRQVKPAGQDCTAIVSAGGETFMVYALDSSGEIADVVTGNKCASGTGEFYLQQLRRMDVTLAEADRWSQTEAPYPVSGRCSVFCKSDCTHAINKGVPRSRVAAGLSRMMADNILNLLKNISKRRIMLVGGASQNRMLVSLLKAQVDDLIIPEAATYFEALGAALWALENHTKPFTAVHKLFTRTAMRFDRLPPLSEFRDRVRFRSMPRGRTANGDTCLLGLDVGSTTTKAVLLRHHDNALLASVYLRTRGDPVNASRRCYGAIVDQIGASADAATVTIAGLGVCGSGRQIAGLHAGTEGVMNEIIAHGAAAVHFDSRVDTVLEIGGQDAKYTHITAGVPSDYAMNEACSAGTGSFLEESARETLGIDVRKIAGIALRARRPPNFNDQCAAFIASDIKTAIHEGMARDDIVAGLVYSICMNYINRVKGNRPIGRRIFMQGGVCYNRAVPLAMAALLDRKIVVPPEPGLMGAFGAALEAKKRIAAGLMAPSAFDLDRLHNQRVEYGKRFICRAGGSRCDRRCEIAMVHVAGRRFPFGGACNRYDNLRRRIRVNADALDLVAKRQDIFWLDDRRPSGDGLQPLASRGENRGPAKRPVVGINRSFLIHTYFPLLAAFFEHLGFDIRVPETPSKRGMAAREAPFCYPVELSHGFFHRLIDGDRTPDYLFLPHIKTLPGIQDDTNAFLCPFVQGESYYLRTTFRKQLARIGLSSDRILSPVLNLASGLRAIRAPLIQTARQMGISRRIAGKAVDHAIAVQRRRVDRIARRVRRTMTAVAEHPDRIAVVIFGRPYNAAASEANMGIPRKLASRGIAVLPLDGLPVGDREAQPHMYWALGQQIIRAARLVADHPRLFGIYITHFSCGPDSFVINYFRAIMGSKPSLTLELDSHTADAGLETRIDAFLDVVAAWRQLPNAAPPEPASRTYVPARMAYRQRRPGVVASSGRWLPLTDSRVTLLFPSMGRLSSEALAAALAGEGIHSIAAPPADDGILKKGRANTSCKECLPLILTTGTLLDHLQHRRPDEITVYFMATGGGPCRFGQYRVFLERLIAARRIENVTLFSLNSDNGYDGLGLRVHHRAWQSVVLADVMEDVRAMLLANAIDPQAAMDRFAVAWDGLIRFIRSGSTAGFERRLDQLATMLRRIELRRPVETVPVIALVGEIFVRRDGISRQYLTERLAQLGFACRCAPVAEWIHYTDWLVSNGLGVNGRMPWHKKIGFSVKRRIMNRAERRIKHILSRSGLIPEEPVDVAAVVRQAQPYVAPDHLGESILTVGSALMEVATRACGVIAIGPFGCMPNRMAESILNNVMTPGDKIMATPGDHRLEHMLNGLEKLPFLAVESDGSPFPQVVEAKLEAFCLRARRLHERMQRQPPADSPVRHRNA